MSMQYRNREGLDHTHSDISAILNEGPKDKYYTIDEIIRKSTVTPPRLATTNQTSNNEDLEPKSPNLIARPVMPNVSSDQLINLKKLKESSNINNKALKLLKNTEKTKIQPKKENIFLVKKNKENPKIVRVDRNGTEILRKNKRKVHITYVDHIDDLPLVNVIEIESFKKYNYIKGLPKEDLYLHQVNSNCTCCAAF